MSPGTWESDGVESGSWGLRSVFLGGRGGRGGWIFFFFFGGGGLGCRALLGFLGVWAKRFGAPVLGTAFGLFREKKKQAEGAGKGANRTYVGFMQCSCFNGESPFQDSVSKKE